LGIWGGVDVVVVGGGGGGIGVYQLRFHVAEMRSWHAKANTGLHGSTVIGSHNHVSLYTCITDHFVIT
jgi:hypothetical protein